MHSALYPVKVPTSTAECTSSSCVSMRHERALLGRDLHHADAAELRGLADQLLLDRVGRRAVRDEVLVDVGTEEERLGIGHGPTLRRAPGPSRSDGPRRASGRRRVPAERLGREHLERAAGGRRPREPLGVAPGARPTGGRAGAGSPRTRSSAATSSSGPSARRPDTPSATASACPAMRVATAGVPHAAASVTVIPHPSRADALASTQARR